MNTVFSKLMLVVLVPLQLWITPTLYGQNKRVTDLDDFVQDFVLESKQISIPEFPQAFNPSFVKWKQGYLMSFRIRDPLTRSTYRIGVIKLNKNFDVEGFPYELVMPIVSNNPVIREQDPRLITIKDEVYITYSSSVPATFVPETRRMFIAKLIYKKDEFLVREVEGPFSFEGESEMRCEKNWTPFIYKNQILLTYSINPHRILRQEPGKTYCKVVAETEADLDWNYGVLRGGTQACLEGNNYISFFHSSINLATKQSKGSKITHYFMGAYLFSSKPPFEITHISPTPIVGLDYYRGEPYKTWKPLRVVFPGGLILDEEFAWVACGKQDHEIWIYKYDKKGLIDSLVPVKSK